MNKLLTIALVVVLGLLCWALVVEYQARRQHQADIIEASIDVAYTSGKLDGYMEAMDHEGL